MLLWLMNLGFAGGSQPDTTGEDLYARVDEGQETFRRTAESDLNYPRLDEAQTGYRRT
jgi:hypothetical protein